MGGVGCGVGEACAFGARRLQRLLDAIAPKLGVRRPRQGRGVGALRLVQRRADRGLRRLALSRLRGGLAGEPLHLRLGGGAFGLGGGIGSLQRRQAAWRGGDGALDLGQVQRQTLQGGVCVAGHLAFPRLIVGVALQVGAEPRGFGLRLFGVALQPVPFDG